MTSASRPPAVAGQFYPADGTELARQVEACFTDPRGPGELPPRHRRADRRTLAIVVPHAGYVYSGAIAAHAYARVAAERPPQSVLVLGVDHHGMGRGATLSARPWSIPIGPVSIDLDLLHALDHPPLRVDERAQSLEHSIEVQLPFLDYVLPHPAFVPLQVGFAPFESLERVGTAVREAIAGRDVLLVASTDLSHYVPVATADRLDHRAIDPILAGDARRLYDTVVGEEISMCGIAPTTVLLSALAGRPRTAELLRWGHSGEVARMRDVVGYAAIVIEEGGSPRPSVK
jgi:hypothetical protein